MTLPLLETTTDLVETELSMPRDGQGRCVTLITPDGERFRLHDTAADIVLFVAALAAELNQAEFGQLTIDFSEGQLKPSLRKSYPAIKRQR